MASLARLREIGRALDARRRACRAFLVLLLPFVVAPGAARCGEPVGVGERPPAVAGRFYAAAAGALEEGIRAYLADAVPPRTGRPVALVAPHAGYIYSGQIAADAYRQAIDHEYDLVVILGTNHTTPPFNGVSVHRGTGYRTPLGLAEIDRDVAAALAAAGREFAFRPEVHKREHSVEVQVPFVQVAFPGRKIVAAVVGRPDPALCDRFGKALAKVLEGRKALIVASSDFSHYPAYEDAVDVDRAVLEAVARLDAAVLNEVIRAQMRRGVPGLSTCACGKAPILAAISAAKALGAERGVVISYANSGDSAMPKRDRVVGYGAVVFSRGPGGPDTSALRKRGSNAAGAEIGPAEKKTLLEFARHSIRRFLASGTAPLARGYAPTLGRKQGVFVTLNKDGRLRGCIGHREADLPVLQVVGAMALQAAFNDRRFSPLSAEELDDVDIEISLLTPLDRVEKPEAVVIGRDGVMLRKDGRSAIYLPKVAAEQGWNHRQLMEQLCLKAGLPRDGWREGAELWVFQADVFSESDRG